MEIYDYIIEGISTCKSSSLSLELYLDSLKKEVKMLRNAYRKHPVYVPYQDEDVQSAYLITYLPHYYQLIEKVLRERNPDNLANKESVTITFIGGGPGSEVFGSIKHIISHNSVINNIQINLLDINAETWSYSHSIVNDYLINNLDQINDVTVDWNLFNLNLTQIEDIHKCSTQFKSSDLVVIQNCINEISRTEYYELEKSIETIFNLIPSNAALLMIDLTSSVRSAIKGIENVLKQKPEVKDIYSTLSQSYPSKMVSINARPSAIIKNHLLNYTDGLIPRKNLTYDYSYISKAVIREDRDVIHSGIQAIYEPLANLDINEAKNRTFVGLDFGTSVSVCTVAHVIENELNLESVRITQKGPNDLVQFSTYVPSIMGIYNRQFMVGKSAFNLKEELELGKNVWYGLKENLGNLESIEYPNSLLKNNSNLKISNAKEALVAYLKYLNTEVENHVKVKNLPKEIYYSVSIPANFPSYKKLELKECLIEAGINYHDTCFTFEPVSALIYAIYNKDVELDFSENISKKIIVLDVGAGTFDVSIMGINKDGEEIVSKLLALQRIDDIGGMKLNEMLAEKIGLLEEYTNDDKLKQSIENLKKMVCNSIPMDSNHLLPALAQSDNHRDIATTNFGVISITFNQVHETMIEYWSLIENTIQKAFKQAELNVYNLDNVILSGGGARNPYLRAKVRDCFKLANMIYPDDIQEQVARGNSLQCFVENSYGKELINTCIAEDIFLDSNKDKRIVFEAGSEAPSLDMAFNENDLVKGELHIINVQLKEKVIFEIPNRFEKGFLYLKPDHEIVCEVVNDNKTTLIKPKYQQL